MAKKPKQGLIIEGITEEGKKFHPSDWAERMSGSLSTFRNRRIIYSPLLRPAVKNGNKCVIIDEQLEQSHPSLYKHVIDFAKQNKLRVGQDQENDGDATDKKIDNTDGESTR